MKWRFFGLALALNLAATQAFGAGLGASTRTAPSPPVTAPVDLAPKNLAFACELRALYASYSGPLLRLRRDSDNAVQDFYPTSTGDFPTAAATTFAAGANLFVATCYDQSGFGNNLTQATNANQPAYVASATNGRPGMQYTAQSAMALCGPHPTNLQDLFNSAGGATVLHTFFPTANPGGNDVLSGKSKWSLQIATGAVAQPRFVQIATGNGIWAGTGTSNNPHVLDVKYSSAPLSNVPAFYVDGAANARTSNTQPTGTITSDAGISYCLGNSAATGGTQAPPGYIFSMLWWSSGSPGAALLEQVRRNEGTYYGVLVQ